MSEFSKNSLFLLSSGTVADGVDIAPEQGFKLLHSDDVMMMRMVSLAPLLCSATQTSLLVRSPFPDRGTNHFEKWTRIALVDEGRKGHALAMKSLLVLMLSALSLMGVTKEFVRIYQPLSMHETDSSNESSAAGDYMQAEIFPVPMVLSGAFPEDLVKAIAMPCKLPTNNPDYKVEEVNLLVLCGVTFQIEREEQEVTVTVVLNRYKKPAEIEITLNVLCEMAIEGIRRTLRSYYRHSEEGGFHCSVKFSGPDEHTALVKGLEECFEVPVGQ